jgi:hypothetical protein
MRHHPLMDLSDSNYNRNKNNTLQNTILWGARIIQGNDARYSRGWVVFYKVYRLEFRSALWDRSVLIAFMTSTSCTSTRNDHSNKNRNSYLVQEV